jgi:hypothetical protein
MRSSALGSDLRAKDLATPASVTVSAATKTYAGWLIVPMRPRRRAWRALVAWSPPKERGRPLRRPYFLSPRGSQRSLLQSGQRKIAIGPSGELIASTNVICLLQAAQTGGSLVSCSAISACRCWRIGGLVVLMRMCCGYYALDPRDSRPTDGGHHAQCRSAEPASLGR